MPYKTTLLIALFLLKISTANATFLRSPNGKLVLNFLNEGHTNTLSVTYLGKQILTKSTIGLHINGLDFCKDVVVTQGLTKTINESWQSINGKQLQVKNNYKEYELHVKKANELSNYYTLIFRVFDTGFAYRYAFNPKSFQDSIKITQELTNLAFSENYSYWAYNHENHNLGPIRRSEKKLKQVNTPVVLKFDNNIYMAIHESAIENLAPFSVNASSNDISMQFNTQYGIQKKLFNTSWRTFLVGEKIGDLVESDLIENLSEPNKIKNATWIKPGKAVWDWRIWGYKTEDGFEYGGNTQSHNKLIDFASENNIQYLVIDADWYGAEFSHESNPTTPKKDIDIHGCLKYAKAKNVGIFLYLNDVGAKQFGLEHILKQFSDWGAVGIKYGFMKGTAYEKVLQTKKVIELCAKYKLMVDFHDSPIAPNGENRTFPNLLTKEFGHSQADAKKSVFPETAVNQPLINMIAGPLDLCNGWFGLNNAHINRTKVFEPIPSTVAAELAKIVAIYSGLIVLPDSPEEYKKKPELLAFIKVLPAQFDSLKVLDAQLDEYVSIARKSGKNWFIGSLTNRSERTLRIDLNFLPRNKSYEATFYEDAPNSHFLHNKEAYTIRKQRVNADTKLLLKLAPGGGNAIYLKQMN
ncbi:glycoside hydrolase family 97 catalytic domain-containing protein [Pedobacter sp. MW01-1-1]|uniref:glycoside hydrolase family 97 catalytic domain-containing protein n=1 Tax=Pedobacter sp. MW01-1-1 TaxID=3383027 RepID=UPI003FF0AAF8